MKKTIKKQKSIKQKKFSNNQIDDLKGWINYYEKNNKFPHDKIICNNCNNSYVSLKGAGLSSLKKQFGCDVKIILTKAICKSCKDILHPKEKKIYVPKVLTREEMEERAEKVRKDIPKIDLNKPRVSIDMVKNKEVCREVTASACWRPDIYLDFGCSECKLVKNCASAIKNLKRKPQNKRGKINYNF